MKWSLDIVSKYLEQTSYQGWQQPNVLFPAIFSVRNIINKPPIYEVYTVAFVEQPSFHSLDTDEDKWLNKLNAQAVAYLRKVAPMTKFKCAPFLKIYILDVGTIFTKNKPEIK